MTVLKPPIATLRVDGCEYPVGKLVQVDIPKKRFEIEEMADGRMRVTCTRGFGDVNTLDCIELRQNKGQP